MSKKTVDNKKDIEKLKEEAEKLYKAPNTSVDSVTGAVGVTTATSDSFSTSTPITQYGWVCPKCGRVNAPWKGTCDCSKGVATPNTPPNTPSNPPFPHTPYYAPPIEIPNPFDPYGPYKWGDAPGWWDKGPTCEGGKIVFEIEYPDGHREPYYPTGSAKPIPCTLKQEGTGDYVDLNINTSISSEKDSNITAWNGKGVN